jgi:hypothetical protein
MRVLEAALAALGDGCPESYRDDDLGEREKRGRSAD